MAKASLITAYGKKLILLSGAGATDHGLLDGLEDDDHEQYLDETRHDALTADNPHSVTAAQAGALTETTHDLLAADNPHSVTAAQALAVATADHTTAAHDALDIDAATLDGSVPADFAAALGADDNYVTDAEKVVVGNTSNTNTGDQDAVDVATSTTSFDGVLSSADDEVQAALDTLDDHTHASSGGGMEFAAFDTGGNTSTSLTGGNSYTISGLSAAFTPSEDGYAHVWWESGMTNKQGGTGDMRMRLQENTSNCDSCYGTVLDDEQRQFSGFTRRAVTASTLYTYTIVFIPDSSGSHAYGTDSAILVEYSPD